MAIIVDGVRVAIAPPDGYVVDFDHPARNSELAAYWLYGAGNFFCLLFMLQRVYVRAVIQKVIRIEDVCLFIAYVFSVVLQTITIRDFARGVIGVHAWEIPLSKYVQYYRTTYLLPILYNPVQCGAKMALLLLYRHLTTQRWFRLSIWTVSFVVVGSSVAITFTTIFPCRPISAAWDYGMKEYKCIDRTSVYQATAIIGAITDAMVLAVPIPVVLPLQISKRQKIGLIAIFCVGFVTVFTSIMRLVELIKSMHTLDSSWGSGPVLLWILVEANLSCICGSLPTVKPFLAHVSPRILGSTNRSSKTGPSLSNPAVPASFGGTRQTSKARHDRYHRFDDTPMYPLQTVSNIEAERIERAGKRGSNWIAESFDGPGDSGSEKGIVQTRTTTVTYSR